MSKISTKNQTKDLTHDKGVEQAKLDELKLWHNNISTVSESDRSKIQTLRAKGVTGVRHEKVS